MVAYVDGDHGTDNELCTKAMPCTKIDKAAQLKAIVKVSGTVKEKCSFNNVNDKLILSDPGALLKPMADVALEVKGNSSIEIHDLEISNMSDMTPAVTLADPATLKLTRVSVHDSPGNGITVTGGQLTCTKCLIASNGVRGIDASAGTITVTRSMINNNANGGIRVTAAGAFHIVSNFVFGNGSPTKPAGSGILIQVDPQPIGAPPNELDFNSVSRNVTFDTGQGIQCTSPTLLIASNNIIWNNGSPTSPQVNNIGCSYIFSDIGPTGIIPLDSNTNTDPMFEDEITGNLHLTKDSIARHAANPATILNVLSAKDIDGNDRANPFDMGAHQFPR
jgi:hypothetical protein